MTQTTIITYTRHTQTDIIPLLKYPKSYVQKQEKNKYRKLKTRKKKAGPMINTTTTNYIRNKGKM